MLKAILLNFLGVTYIMVSVQAQNLIINGDAESGTGSGDGSSSTTIPGWSLVDGFNFVQYDTGGGFPALSDFGPVSRGLNFFSGGENNHYSSASQIIDLSPYSSNIDVGGIGFILSGFFGGYLWQNDNALLTMSFRDSMGGSLSTAVVGGVTAIERESLTGLLYRDISGSIPVGTRDAHLLLEMRRTDGGYNDGYADNLSLELSTIPEPSTYAASIAVAVISALAYARRAQFRKCA